MPSTWEERKRTDYAGQLGLDGSELEEAIFHDKAPRKPPRMAAPGPKDIPPFKTLLEPVPETELPAEIAGIDLASAAEGLAMLACPFYRGVGICQDGCWDEPACQTGEPEGGWETQVREAVMADRKLMFSVTPADCEMQTFRAGGNGGQNQNKRDTGVRYIHHPSGARGESREERSQMQNRRAAWRRMVENPKFQLWVDEALRAMDGIKPPEERVEEDLAEENLIVEIRDDGKWVKL